MNNAQITAVLPGNIITAKAFKVTVHTVNGESFRADTTWLPKSICSNIQISQCDEGDGYKYNELTATVPIWWIRKLDTRAAWEHAGMRSAPMATRPL